MLLQKTLLNIEGLGRELDPDLDLWRTAKPYLERWMNEQVGWRALLRTLKNEAPYWATTLPSCRASCTARSPTTGWASCATRSNRLADESARRNDLTAFVAALLAVALLVALISFL